MMGLSLADRAIAPRLPRSHRVPRLHLDHRSRGGAHGGGCCGGPSADQGRRQLVRHRGRRQADHRRRGHARRLGAPRRDRRPARPRPRRHRRGAGHPRPCRPHRFRGARQDDGRLDGVDPRGRRRGRSRRQAAEDRRQPPQVPGACGDVPHGVLPGPARRHQGGADPRTVDVRRRRGDRRPRPPARGPRTRAHRGDGCAVRRVAQRAPHRRRAGHPQPTDRPRRPADHALRVQPRHAGCAQPRSRPSWRSPPPQSCPATGNRGQQGVAEAVRAARAAGVS